jgi:hypothetical protein
MRKVANARMGWKKPQIKPLGTIKDVANAQGTGSQAAGTKT